MSFTVTVPLHDLLLIHKLWVDTDIGLSEKSFVLKTVSIALAI